MIGYPGRKSHVDHSNCHGLNRGCDLKLHGKGNIIVITFCLMFVSSFFVVEQDISTVQRKRIGGMRAAQQVAAFIPHALRTIPLVAQA